MSPTIWALAAKGVVVMADKMSMRKNNKSPRWLDRGLLEYLRMTDSFGISEFNRPGYNTGWLISNLVKLNSPTDKDLLRKFLYYETQ